MKFKTKHILLFCIVSILSCKYDVGSKQNKNQTFKLNSDESNSKSIIDLEYLNDTLGIAVNDFRIINLEGDNYEIVIEMETSKTKRYSKDHGFFVHFFPYDSLEEKQKFIPLGTNQLVVKNNTILFLRKFSTQRQNFRYVRYGLLNKTKNERYFMLTLDSICITN